MLGMRLANACKTDEARRVAYCSSAVPPESIKTTIAATRYSRMMTAVTIETAGQKIGAEFARKKPSAQLRNQGNAAGRYRDEQGEFGPGCGNVADVAQR